MDFTFPIRFMRLFILVHLLPAKHDLLLFSKGSCVTFPPLLSSQIMISWSPTYKYLTSPYDFVNLENTSSRLLDIRPFCWTRLQPGSKLFPRLFFSSPQT
eukprot:TRINITY_DN9843_c0_g1_i1.p1 TRINITY_DN9843_c0_g1~~TRINITY_DN9843_c0_g1_i1.p1  ORF type:complete len:100 (-),score=6.56 TRINITY_DN9843_c0_g1_i1:27-326(-)